MKTASTLTLAGAVLAFFAANVSAQPPGMMGQGQGGGMGMGGGMMMNQMKMMDQDGDGKISQEEWTAYHEKRFQQMDANGDGYIDSQEFSQGMRAMKEKMKGGMMSAPMPQGGAPGQPPQQ
jgi:Spy/CpxP family protein refolding chaperone